MGRKKIKIMKVILAALNAKYVHSNLAIRYLRREIEEEFDVEIYESSINDDTLKISLDILSKQPDVVAFSCYIWNIENTYKIINAIKNANSDIKIILGGPEVSFDAAEILMKNKSIDFIIKGEGEKVIKPLIFAIEKNNLENLIDLKGIVFRYNEKIFDTGFAETILDLDEIKFSYEKDIPDKIIYYEASRGCPYRCSYCMSSIDKKLRFRSIDVVKKELKHLIDNNVKLIKFVDRTFNANKKFARDIWQFLIDLNPDTCFHFEIAADILDEEDLNILSKAKDGLFQFEIGVQSTNKEVLKNINRVMNFEIVSKNVSKIKEFGNIHCHLDLIVGLPGEDLESFKKSFNDVMEIRPDELQLGFLKVLKGAPLSYQKEEYGIRHIEYPPYHVLKTKDISVSEVKWLMRFEQVFDNYYNSHIFERTMYYILQNVNNYFDFFQNITDYLEKTDYFVRNIGLAERFKFLYEFLIDKFDNSIIKDLLIYDYLITTKKSNIPDFLKKNTDIRIERIFEKNKENIVKKFNLESFKGLFAIPMGLSICKLNDKFDIILKECIVIFDLKNQKYYILNQEELS